MISHKALLKYLKEIADKGDLSINENRYTNSQVKIAEKLIRDLGKELELKSTKPKLSRRRAFIVILEELYYDTQIYPEDLTLDIIHKRASLRFEYMNRDSRGLETPMQVHPKNPCLYYEDNGYGKARYRSALELIVINSDKFFQVPEAEASIKMILEDVKLC